MHDEFTAAPKRHAIKCRDNRNMTVLDVLRSMLEQRHHLFEFCKLPGKQSFQRLSEIGACSKRWLALPYNQCAVIGLGLVNRLVETAQHTVADRVHLGLEGSNGNVFMPCSGPEPYTLILKNRFAFFAFF